METHKKAIESEQGGIFLHISAPPLKGFGDGAWGRERKGEKEKKQKFKKNIILSVPNNKTELVKHNLTLFTPKFYSFINLWGMKSRGKEIKSCSSIYTPASEAYQTD